MNTKNNSTKTLEQQVAAKIRAKRRFKNFSLREFSYLLGWNNSKLAKIETNNRHITIQDFYEICIALGVEPNVKEFIK